MLVPLMVKLTVPVGAAPDVDGVTVAVRTIASPGLALGTDEFSDVVVAIPLLGGGTDGAEATN